MRPDWLLVDGSSLIFRAFYALPPDKIKAADGRPVNAVRGSLDNLARLISDRRPRAVALATDEDWRPAWRVEALPGYKAHRVAEPVPPLLIPQMPLITALLEAAGVPVMGVAGYEAEDVVASLAAKIDGRVVIYSGDRDLFALVRDPDRVVLYPERGGLAEITEAEVERRYGIPGRRYADYAVLRGDPSDGLPGLRGVGDRQAAALVRRWGGVAELLAGAELNDTARDYLQRASRVVMPVTDLRVEVPAPPSTIPADPEKLEKLSRDLRIEPSASRLVTALKTVASSE